MSTFEQVLSAYTMAVRDHQAYMGSGPFNIDANVIKTKEDRCAELRARLVAMFNAPAQPYAGEPFDLERARKGEAITYEGQEVQFVGLMSSGNIVVELNNPGSALVVAPDALRMAPRKMRTVYANIYLTDADGHVGYAYGDAETARNRSSDGALCVAYPVQIPE